MDFVGKCDFKRTNIDHLFQGYYFSDWKRLSSDAEDIVLTATFAEPALQFAGTTLVVALGLEVSMAEGDTSSMNRPGFGTMKIVACFV
jgi:hypothetical protein